jgi:hypothetical protein
MNTSVRCFSQSNHGLTRTVTCVDKIGPDAGVLFSEFDLQGRLLYQVRFDHLERERVYALFSQFGPNGEIQEQWVLLIDESGRVTQTFGFDEQGRPLEEWPEHSLAC